MVTYIQSFLSKGSLYLRRKGVKVLNHCDLILHLVNELIAEKEKNIKLQQEKEQQQMQNDKNNVKTNM